MQYYSIGPKLIILSLILSKDLMIHVYKTKALSKKSLFSVNYLNKRIS